MVNLPCLWGSLSQLPSSHLFIHRVPAKLSNRVYALRSKLLPATALVFVNLDGSGTAFLWWTELSVDAPIVVFADRFVRISGFFIRSLRVTIQNPTRPTPLSRDPGRVLECCLLRFSYLINLPSGASLPGVRYLTAFFAGSYLSPVVSSLYMILSSLQAITISDCIFFSGFSVRVV
jgi:hypothetical protein